MKKQKTNRQELIQAIKELSDIDLAILRERLLTACEYTINNKETVINENEKSFISPGLIIGACERIFEKLEYK